jgi:hypothetical protein
MSIRDPVPGRTSLRSIFFAILTKRAAAMPTIAVPRTISVRPAISPNFCPGNDRVRPAKDGAANSRNRSNFSTRNPKAILAMAVRTQARKVRSFAECNASQRSVWVHPSTLSTAATFRCCPTPASSSMLSAPRQKQATRVAVSFRMTLPEFFTAEQEGTVPGQEDLRREDDSGRTRFILAVAEADLGYCVRRSVGRNSTRLLTGSRRQRQPSVK